MKKFQVGDTVRLRRRTDTATITAICPGATVRIDRKLAGYDTWPIGYLVLVKRAKDGKK